MNKYENIIIGAGPAGLQLGYFFEKAKMNYIIIEKGKSAATFFSKYPHTGTLISINKKYTGNDNKDFNLRHDWNSLLNDENLLFTNYSDEYYPNNKDLVTYLNDFANNNKLNIIYDATVNTVNKNEDGYSLEISINKEESEISINKEDKKTKSKKSKNNITKIAYTCNKLIVATGLSKPNKPDWIYRVKKPILHYSEYPKNFFKKEENLEKFKNKSVLFIGTGNSSFELANHLNKYCSSITITGRSVKPWSMSTHYTGDLRSIYLPFWDTFLLKSLNAVITSKDYYNYIFEQNNIDEPYTMKYICAPTCNIEHNYSIDNSFQTKFDNVILCTGWKFDDSIFNFDLSKTLNDNYPFISNHFESINNKNLFFIGSLMHSLDYKKSSGGFIHGFRYLIKHFFDINYMKSYEIITTKKIDELVNHILYKINNSDALYQMYGKLSDIFFMKDNEFIYFNNVPVDFHERIIIPIPEAYYFVLTLEYGSEQITDMKNLGKKISKIGFENKSPLLHFVIRISQFKSDIKTMLIIDEVHFDEDLYADFSNIHRYKEKLLRTLKMFFNY